MKSRNKHRNKHRSLVLSSTFVGLVCGLVLTHQQAYAAQTPLVSNQESQITAVAAPNNNLNKTAAVNQDYSAENMANSAASGPVTPSTYSSSETTTNSKQQPANSDATAAAPIPNTGATGPVDNGTATSTNPGNNNSTTPATNSPTQDTGNSATTPTTGADNPANGNSANTPTSSEQPNTNIIAQGTWGTSKWDYTQEGDDYILHLHAGTLGTPGKYKDDNGYIWGEGIGSLNTAFNSQLTQIIIDPGVIANQDSRSLFSDLIKLKTIQGLENLDTSRVTNMYEMFWGCNDLTSLDVSHFNTSQVTNMSEMFDGCHSLTSLDISHFDTSQVTDMGFMFSFCKNLTSLDVSHFDTSQVTDMMFMFSDCHNLTNLDVSHFDTSQVTNMYKMFSNCYRLTILDLSNWDTSKDTNMSEMFSNCNYLTSLNLSNWDTSKVTNMSAMFKNCSSLTNLDLSHFNTAQVIYMYQMFADCKNLTSLDLSSFDTSQLINSVGYDFSILADCTNLHHLVLGPKIQLIGQNGWISDLPAVPAAGTKIPGTDRVVTAPYWVATSGYQKGQRYTSAELEQLTGRDQVTTYDWASQPLFASTVNSKVVTRTINVHNPDGTTHSEKQTVMLSQEIKNNADGTQTVGPWSTAQWEAYAIPEIAGYTANPSAVAAQTVNEKTQEQTVDVYYEPVLQQITVNYLDNGKIVGTQILSGYAGETIIPQYRAPKGYEIIDQPQGQVSFTTAQQQIIQVAVQAQILKTSETKSLIRTVNIHRPSGTIQTYRQPVVLMRTVYVNAVNGAKSYGSWSVGSWDAVPVPVIIGYTASQAQVAAQQVTAQDSDQLLDIYYTKA